MPSLVALSSRAVVRRACRVLMVALLTLGFRPATAEDLVVAAAASLSNAFQDIGSDFERQHPGTHVILTFAASDVLLTQIDHGAPADVFASADEMTMDRAVQYGRVDAASRRDFAGNALVLIVPHNAGTVPHALADLVQSSYARIAIGNPESVPAGRYAQQALQTAQLWAALQPRVVPTQNVRQALDYVARGEVDAGFVYATDAASQSSAVRVALTVPTTTQVRYPAAAVASCALKPIACEFVQFLLSAQSRATLSRYGFSALGQ